MNNYLEAYVAATGKTVPAQAQQLIPLFDQMAAGELLPPKGQQAVDQGFTAHTFNDSRENPAIYEVYQWVVTNCFKEPVRELSAKLIGMAFTSANVFQSNLPQPLTLNPWQIDQMATTRPITDQAVIVENNGIFIWLAHRHPEWPLINQSGNDFNGPYVEMIQRLERQGVRLTYLGDLDSPGIRIAHQLFGLLSATPAEDLMALQTPQRVLRWLTLYGKPSMKRTKLVTMPPSIFRDELLSIHLLKKFVEQEQLIREYEQLIPKWLER